MKKRGINYLFYCYYYNFIKEDCITCLPDHYFYGYIFQKISDLPFCKVLGNKNFYSLLYPDVLTPVEIAKVNNGVCFDGKNNHITREQMYALLKKDRKYIIKPSINSSGGNNVVVLTSDDIEKFNNYYANFQNFIIQEFIDQSDKMKVFSKKSVNTFRIYSLFHEDETTILCACLRFGQGDSIIDNFCQGGAYIPIDLKTSRFWDFAIDKHGNKILTANGYEFGGKEVQFLPDIYTLIRKMHPFISKSKIIAWDFAISKDDKPIFIEYNLGASDAGLLQICSRGRPFGKYTEQFYKMLLPRK